MALLDRLKERLETDLSDTELEAVLDEAVAEITRRCGPVADPAEPLSVLLRGARRLLYLARPIDPAHQSTVTISEHTFTGAGGQEWWPSPGWDGFQNWDGWDPYSGYWDIWPADVTETVTQLAADDWRTWNSGRSVQRLPAGTHPRAYWGPVVTVSYVPVDDSAQRDEVTIKLAMLTIEYEGVIERRVGDVQTLYGLRSATGGGSPLIYADERERLISSLLPHAGGLALR